MEKLNIFNYEVWMIDWKEGKLSPDQEETLLQFLGEHPEIDALTPDSDWPVLMPSNESCPDKSDLFKSGMTVPEASEFEIQCIARLEGDMIPAEQVLFDQKLESDPEYASVYEQFTRATLHAEQNIVFEEKDKLKKKTIRIPAFVYGALASAAALILGWFIVSPMLEETSLEEMAQDTSRQIIYLDKLAHPARFDKIAATKPKQNLSESEGKSETINILAERPPLEELANIPALPRQTAVLHSSTFVKDYSLASQSENQKNPDEYLSLLEFTSDMIRKRILGQDSEMVEKNRFSIWEVADVGLEQVAGFMNLEADIDRSYDDQGELVSVDFDSRLVAFSTPVRQKRTGK
ncbi:MAG: hypothetical protein HN352_06340 [Bacteroidetes bacterium]|jgi:hypothetical protein|nr:hypothetical protein [Bacteroidota bacterium]MBT3749988.1 hypothetical protein [Bacteroidota bacterium]MBT4399006.1 hypothetical protein [Bacteroidota bacterium]MBT4409476.1 hypothetical protein [Bacteroidota bacterium]MBT5426709.1 hypothetical protein [Bacteroidota bacterium]